ncbi:MAG: hypothetical protein ACREUC_22885, partial [Steroidobacteraceae bacterium]
MVDCAVRLHGRNQRHDTAAEHESPSVEFGRILLAEGGAAQGNSGQIAGETRPIRRHSRTVCRGAFHAGGKSL